MAASEDTLAAGVDLGGTTFGVGLCYPTGRHLAAASHPTPQAADGHAVFRAILTGIRQLVESQGLSPAALAGVGIGVPGLVDPAAGLIHDCPNLSSVNGLPAAALLREGLGVPAYVANDAFCATLGELRYGAGQGVENLLMLTLGTGIGGGVALGNRVMRGPRQLMGEIGHMTVLPDGPRCGCGSHGCLEAVVAKQGMIDLALRRLQEARPSLIDELTGGRDDLITPQIIAQAAQQGDPLALEVIAEVGKYLGIAIGNAVVMLDPDLVLIGGGIAAAGEVLLQAIRRSVRHRAQFSRFDPDNVCFAALGNDAGVWGAAALVWETDETGLATCPEG